MSNHLSNVVWLVVVGMLVAAGCAPQISPEVNALAVGPDAEALVVESEDARLAIEAAGGLAAWTKTRKVDFDCVSTFFQPDGTFYVTEQRYEAFPWSNSLRISGVEPAGEYAWQLLQGRLGVLQGVSQYDGLNVGLDSGCIAEGILSVMTAPVRMLDQSVEFRVSGQMVKLEGHWYKPLKRVAKADVPDALGLRDAAFYQKRSSARVDVVLLKCARGDGVLIARGHDYTLLGKGGIAVPSKIELFKADAEGRVRQRIVQIDVK